MDDYGQGEKLQLSDAIDEQEPIAARKPDLEALYNRKPILPPSSGTVEKDIAEARYAPPPKFAYAKTIQDSDNIDPPNSDFQAPAVMPLYGKPPALRTEQETPLPSGQRDPYYQVEPRAPEIKQKKKRNKPLTALICLVAAGAIVAAGYAFREPIMSLFNGEEQPPVAVVSAKAYDAAPARSLGEGVQRSIDDIAGGVWMEPFAVTDSRVITRTEVGGGLYDYYLFSGNGVLLGYYENMRPEQVAVLENELLYVDESPYLFDKNGRALFSMDNYRHMLDSEPVIGPIQNGIAILSDERGSTYNYINEKGELISTLWFARAFPFTGERTLAYVDTGASGSADERYYLYLLSKDGASTLIKRCKDMTDIEFCAMDMALWSNGELCALDSPQTALISASEVIGYPDCDILVVRDAGTGKLGLYQGGKPLYACEYDQIEPITSDMEFISKSVGRFALRGFAGVGYPAPMTYYFKLTRGESSDVVGFALRSRYARPIEVYETEAD